MVKTTDSHVMAVRCKYHRPFSWLEFALAYTTACFVASSAYQTSMLLLSFTTALVRLLIVTAGFRCAVSALGILHLFLLTLSLS